MESASFAILLVLSMVAFANYRNGTLGPWLRAKFYNAGDPSRPSGDAKNVGDPLPKPDGKTGAGGFVNPTGGPCISGWGAPRSGGRSHKGVDLGPTTVGAPIRAAAAGRVIRAGNAGGLCGERVAIAHPGGYETIYCHLSEVTTAAGREVTTADVIGKVGHTGNASASTPHLHFEIHHNGQATNPAPLIGVAC